MLDPLACTSVFTHEHHRHGSALKLRINPLPDAPLSFFLDGLEFGGIHETRSFFPSLPNYCERRLRVKRRARAQN